MADETNRMQRINFKAIKQRFEKIEYVRKNNKHLTFAERRTIEKMLWQKKTKAEIARKLNVCASTIARELQRNSYKKNEYDAIVAEKIKNFRKKTANQMNAKKNNLAILNLITIGLSFKLSPEQIKYILKEDFNILISQKTIYNIIRENREQGINLYKDLRLKNKKRHWQSKKGIVMPKKNLKQRPLIADQSRRVGDFETDLMEGTKDGFAIAVIRDRKSSFMLAKKLKNKTAIEFNKALQNLFSKIEAIETITMDNGTETALWQDVEEMLNTQVYFCNPGQPWQKGGVENGIGLLRQFFPKGKSLKNVSQKEINLATYLINYYRPFKKLYNSTPAEIFLGVPRKKLPQKKLKYKFSLIA